MSRIDSIMLLEEGFQVTSIDASDKMLKYALKKRWDRRKEDAFDKWGMNQFYFKMPHFFLPTNIYNFYLFFQLLRRPIG